MRHLAIGAMAILAWSGSHAADAFGDYWYRGLAEVTSYELEQARYGAVHPGHAVLIFVTEDFSRSKQVKLDRPRSAGADAVKVLKLNLTKKFDTGIYPYSMMSSIFTAIDGSGTLKVTTSAQEWCGHTFAQLNRSGKGYRARLYSYFESEGDRELELEDAPFEDEIWNRIRLEPDALPRGELRLVPGTMYLRLRHEDWRAQSVRATLETAKDDPAIRIYTLSYPELQRTLTIRFRAAFPHEIEGWEEDYRSGFGADAEQRTTRATRIKRILLDYWRHNTPDDARFRQELGLD